MPVVINGSTGISGTDGSAGTPAVQGTDTNTGVFFPAADTIAFAEGGVEAMRIDSSGNVGIGTSSMTGFGNLFIGGAFSSIYYNNASGSFNVGTTTSTSLTFGTNNTVRATIDSSGNFQFNSGYGSVATAYGCRAWVNFNGTGVVAIRASGNVSSITDNGTGDYTVNFTTAMPDTNFAPVVACASSDSSNAANPGIYGWDVINPNTSSCRIAIAVGSSGRNDVAVVDVAVFR